MMKRLFSVWNNYEPVFKLSRKLYRDVKGLIKFMRDAAEEVIVEQQKKICEENYENEDENTSNKSLINLLLDPKNNFSHNEINDEICSFIIAVS
jgi:hypothetical protein